MCQLHRTHLKQPPNPPCPSLSTSCRLTWAMARCCCGQAVRQPAPVRTMKPITPNKHLESPIPWPADGLSQPGSQHRMRPKPGLSCISARLSYRMKSKSSSPTCPSSSARLRWSPWMKKPSPSLTGRWMTCTNRMSAPPHACSGCRK